MTAPGHPMPKADPEAVRGANKAVRTCRQKLYKSRMGLVEHLTLRPHFPAPSGHNRESQIVFPYSGLFGINIGRRSAVLDANRTLFVRKDQDFAETRPLPAVGYAATVLTPAPELLEEIGGRARTRPTAAFDEMSRPASMKLRLLTHQLIRLRDEGDNAAQLEGDELIVASLQEALAGRGGQALATPPRIVNRAKELLHAYDCARLSLHEIASQIGVSPVYLTQTFTLAEGVPLYRYQLRLRLSKALELLPDCEDITGLALDLGFFSHSHFGSSFKSAFGMSPSSFREMARRRRRREDAEI